MSGWGDGPMLGFDLETTGTDPETARIVTATTVLIRPGEQPKVREWLVDPGVDIPAEAAAVHGVTTEKAAADGIAPAAALIDIDFELRDAWADDVPVVIMNAAYDLTVVARELDRHCGIQFRVSGPVIDPMCIDRAVDKYRRGKRTLTDLTAHYGVKMAGAHTSTGDALAAARVAWKLARVYPKEVGQLSLTDLHRAQAGWRSEWAAGFTDYLRSQGKNDRVDGSWPVREVSHA
jgi:DNA polymerase-3 subunit epsilon